MSACSVFTSEKTVVPIWGRTAAFYSQNSVKFVVRTHAETDRLSVELGVHVRLGPNQSGWFIFRQILCQASGP
jgi:hypothetical protein